MGSSFLLRRSAFPRLYTAPTPLILPSQTYRTPPSPVHLPSSPRLHIQQEGKHGVQGIWTKGRHMRGPLHPPEAHVHAFLTPTAHVLSDHRLLTSQCAVCVAVRAQARVLGADREGRVAVQVAGELGAGRGWRGRGREREGRRGELRGSQHG